MAAQKAKKVEVVVIGDVYWDTVIIPLPGDCTATRRPQHAYARIDQPGGAWLLETLIEMATKIKVKGYGTKKPRNNKYGIDIEVMRDDDKLRPDKCRRALTVLELFYKDADEKEKQKVYRISQKHDYGWVQPGGKFPEESDFGPLNQALEVKLKESDSAHHIVVISETENHIFRQQAQNADFVQKITASPNSWLVFCMAGPLGEGTLWETIEGNDELLKRTLVVLSAASLRSAGLYVRGQAAQETIALDLAAKFQVPKIQNLSKCSHIIVRFDPDSVFHFDTGRNFFDNYLRPFEGGPQTNPDRYGTMSGYGEILVASIVKEMVDSIKESSPPFDRIGKGICDGLRRGAAHFSNGFAPKGFPTDYLKGKPEPTPLENLFKFPLKRLFQRCYIDDLGQPKLEEEDKIALPLLGKIHLPIAYEQPEKWSRVEWFKECVESKENFKTCLVDVVKKGLEKSIKKNQITKNVQIPYLPEDELPIACPFLRIGKLISVDRDELDWFTDIYKIIQKYLQEYTWKKPLSIAVFGPPGTGKSRAVNEILDAADSPSAVKKLEYNLTQFTKPDNLARAFHKAQDVALSGKVPLVLFDEFDASLPGHPYAWLKYFLAPMQDGKFKGADTEESYTVGRAIFVFAGGINPTFEKFKEETATDVGRNAKGPDFISRLKAHLNIKGINEENKSESARDRLALRRAIILRSILESEMKEIFDSGDTARIADGVIRAFLRVDKYAHGIRSMEAIVKMARPEKGHFWVASLPSSEQLRMHVNDERFLDLARQR